MGFFGNEKIHNSIIDLADATKDIDHSVQSMQRQVSNDINTHFYFSQIIILPLLIHHLLHLITYYNYSVGYVSVKLKR